MAAELPEDVFYLICDELQSCEDFATLFNCAIASKQFAPTALSHLYRMQKSPGNFEDAEGGYELVTLVQRWSIFWRSICLSTMNNTMYPYYHYVRSLDMKDLEDLLEESRFTGSIEGAFFAGAMSHLHHRTKAYYRSMGSGRRSDFLKLDIQTIVMAIAEAIVSKANLLEHVSGMRADISSTRFLDWIPRLPRLKSLQLYYGGVLGHEPIHKAIRRHCPNFEALSIYQWLDDDSDTKLGALINTLPPQTLKGVTTFSKCGISRETCLALNNHSASLRRLFLEFQYKDLPSLALLRSCVNITTLHLRLPSTPDTAQQNQALLEDLTAWLNDCKMLKEIELEEFTKGPDILTPMLLNEGIQLEGISIEAKVNQYLVKDNSDFHHALARQPSLRSLGLIGDGEDASRADLTALVESVRTLTNLRKLNLRGVADELHDLDITRMLTPLHCLEDLCVGGWNVADAILDTVAMLRNLRSITFCAETAFTAAGLLDFVSQLGPGNEGLHFYIDMADPGSLLTDEELAVVRDAFRAQVSGKLDYIPLRDPDLSEFEGESD